MGWGKGLYGKGETTWNLNNPMRRDTVSIPGNSHVILRIAGDNSGVWAFHCHLLWHAHGELPIVVDHPHDSFQLIKIAGGMFAMIGQGLETLRSMLDELSMSSEGQSIIGQFCSSVESENEK